MDDGTCSVQDCAKPKRIRGWCAAHHSRWLRHGSLEKPSRARAGLLRRLPLEPRFWSKVDKSGDCWEWTGYVYPSGYGDFWHSDMGSVRAHRFAWQLEKGPIPEGLSVLHRCDNRRCVRVAHLFLGTALDNSLDMVRKGRAPRMRHGRWTMTWEACRSCGTTERKHFARGYCSACRRKAA